jgi:hypothetical protein
MISAPNTDASDQCRPLTADELDRVDGGFAIKVGGYGLGVGIENGHLVVDVYTPEQHTNIYF